MPIVSRKLSNGKIVRIEVSSASEDGKVNKEKTLEMLDKAFDRIVQNEIIEYCNILVGAFEQLKEQSIPPKKAHAEFGIQGSAEGNVYLAKIAAQANFKVCLEWDLSDDSSLSNSEH